jgi:hypothetical protein
VHKEFRGVQGTQGSQGTYGIQGNLGLQGTRGFQGIQGFIGAQGSIGIRGALGNQGTQGVQGVQGTLGLKGDPGTSVTILGSYSDYASLVAAHPTGSLGDGYLVGGNLYVWDGSAWLNVGNITGPQGIQGPIGSIGIQGVQGLLGLQGSTGVLTATPPLTYTGGNVVINYGTGLTISGTSLVIDSTVITTTRGIDGGSA